MRICQFCLNGNQFPAEQRGHPAPPSLGPMNSSNELETGEAAMTMTLNTMNLSDVPLVNPADLARPMQYMIDTGRGLAMLRGISKAEMSEVDHALWDELGGNPVQRLAVLMRFRSLVEVFGARRLADLLLHNGYNLIAPAVHVAARMRLNADRGFNPVKFERALHELLSQLGPRRPADAQIAA